ncbi:MAG: hypothetical protein ACKO4T_13970 [Planctomycetaceae bacterium]
MAADPQPPADPHSLASIRAALASLRRATRAWVCVEGLAVVACIAVAGCWVTLAVDRLLEPPAWVRVAMLVAVTAAVAWAVVERLVMRLAVPLDDEALALLVERAHPEFGAAVSTAVSCGGRAAEPLDPDMVAATTAEAADRLRGLRMGAIFRQRRLTALAAAACGALLITGVAAVVRPVEAATWRRRMLQLADVAWPRRVALEVEGFAGGTRVVARGDDVDVLVRAVPAWGDPPEKVELRSRGGGAWRSDRMGGRGATTAAGQMYGHVLGSVTENLDLEIRGGDARLRGLRIVAAEPPAVAALEVAVSLPEYLGGGTRPAVTSRVVAVPRGSSVEVTCTSSTPLASASMALRPATGADAAAAVETPLAALATAGDVVLRGRTPPLDGDAAVVVRLVDGAGLTNREPVAVLLSTVPDQPPRVAVRLAGVSTAVTPQAALPIEGAITDDHGLTGAEVRLAAGDATRVVPIARVVTGAADVTLPADRPELVALATLGLAVGARLSVSVAARDRCMLAGGPQEGTGETWTLDVVSAESLLAMLEAREVLLRRRLEAVIDDLAKARGGAAEAGRRGGPDGDTDDPRAAAVRRCGDAAVRAAGETTEIAGEFRGLHRELVNNGLATADRTTRLLEQIAAPLDAIAIGELPAAVATCRASAAVADASAAVDRAVLRLREVLERMLELETMNEVLERLRGVIRLQEQIRDDTLDRQRRRGREALESP